MKLQKFDYQINPEKKKISFGALAVVLLVFVAGFLVYRSFAVYEVTETYNIIKGSVASFNKDTISLYYYLVDDDGNELSTSEVPAVEDYIYDESRSSCESGLQIDYDEETNTISVNSENEEVCSIYFNYLSPAKKTMIALGDPVVLEGTPDFTKYDSSKVGYYKAKDNYGTTYYYYDANTDNRKYVDYEGFIYTILRVNGDGSLRVMDLIDGSHYENLLYGTNDNAYVGLMYGQVGADSYEATHANITHNQTYHFLSHYDGWFMDELLGDAGYCADRSLYNDSYGEKVEDDTVKGFGTNTTYYGSYYRLRNFTPSLMCDKNDNYTRVESDFGNGKMTISEGARPMMAGFISADELMMTGLLYETSGLNFGTISPWYFKDEAKIFGYNENSVYGALSQGGLANYYGVFNLKAGLEFTGTGTANDPYVIVTE